MKPTDCGSVRHACKQKGSFFTHVTYVHHNIYTLRESAYAMLNVSWPRRRGMNNRMDLNFLPPPSHFPPRQDDVGVGPILTGGETTPLPPPPPPFPGVGGDRKLSFMKSRDSSPITSCLGEVRTIPPISTPGRGQFTPNELAAV